MSLLPNTSFPSSVATATYPIQFDSLLQASLENDLTMKISGSKGIDEVAYRNFVTV
ncbi:hypothetical protein Lalb_Chr15g0089451 [Lupinus albus]|uniref:Uncharacterized protein n=1 Tax=Lupinus albus TaxID=3870 RepID=A0A6A4PCV8_LUPAL|nr:hypothetical protein Lalb_Chr15g0089451 [Lupinus albus]